METTQNKLTLFQKIQAVSNYIRNIQKDMTVGTGSYSYKAVSDLEVTLSVKDAETKYRLISIPVKQDMVNSEVIRIVKKNGDEGLTFVDTIKMTVRIIDLDDDSKFIEIESFGKGIDSGDKGFGKASTYARKYALLNAYKIATGEDPDAEKSKEETALKSVSEKRCAIENLLHADTKQAVDMLKYFNVAEIGDLTDSQINIAYTTFKKKGKL